MEYNEEQIKQIREYASLLMTIQDIATMLDLDIDIFRSDIADISSPVAVGYRKGKIGTTMELRKQEIEMAKLGSALAVELTQKYILEQTLSENG